MADQKLLPKKVVDARMAERFEVITLQMSEKEQHLLSYVYGKVPQPYYVRWKGESNAIFRMLVALKKRRMDLRKGA